MTFSLHDIEELSDWRDLKDETLKVVLLCLLGSYFQSGQLELRDAHILQKILVIVEVELESSVLQQDQRSQGFEHLDFVIVLVKELSNLVVMELTIDLVQIMSVFNFQLCLESLTDPIEEIDISVSGYVTEALQELHAQVN